MEEHDNPDGDVAHMVEDNHLQFLIRSTSDIEVFSFDEKPMPVYKHVVSGTTAFAKWSPLGTYLATVHGDGAAVWRGASTFHRLMEFPHPQVRSIDFSPGEKYLVTYNVSVKPRNPCKRVAIDIFDVRTGEVMRSLTPDDFSIGGFGASAVFKWAGGKDDKYFARMTKNWIRVFETEKFSLVDKSSMKVENVMDFSWSPTDAIIALFVPQLGGNQRAFVRLIQIPNKKVLKQKDLLRVSDCKMYWKSNGEYLAVKVEHYTITRKRYTSIHFFQIKDRGIDLELERKDDKIISFSWEPKGHRFAVIHGDNPSQDISFYSMKSSHNADRISKCTTLRGRKANALFWSPSGCFIILAELKKQMEFYNADERKTMATEHVMVTDIEWDPTGRFVATAVTSVDGTENSFNIWSFNGKLLHRIKGHFFQTLWRPRPLSFISPEKEEEINLEEGIKMKDGLGLKTPEVEEINLEERIKMKDGFGLKTPEVEEINLEERIKMKVGFGLKTPEVESFSFPVSPSPAPEDAAAPAPPAPNLRRQQKKWKPREVEALVEGVATYGKGNWKYILDSKPGVFDGRRAVDLKDKWRNLEKKKKACL